MTCCYQHTNLINWSKWESVSKSLNDFVSPLDSGLEQVIWHWQFSCSYETCFLSVQDVIKKKSHKIKSKLFVQYQISDYYSFDCRLQTIGSEIAKFGSKMDRSATWVNLSQLSRLFCTKQSPPKWVVWSKMICLPFDCFAVGLNHAKIGMNCIIG